MQTPRIDTVRLSDDGSVLVIIDQTLLPGEQMCIRDRYSPYDFFLAGGLEAVMKQAIDAGYMDGSTMTYGGKTLGEMVENARVLNDDCIRPFSNAYTERGGLAVLKGNLAPEGCVIKTSGVIREMWEHTGRAKAVSYTHLGCPLGPA